MFWFDREHPNSVRAHHQHTLITLKTLSTTSVTRTNKHTQINVAKLWAHFQMHRFNKLKNEIELRERERDFKSGKLGELKKKTAAYTQRIRIENLYLVNGAIH